MSNRNPNVSGRTVGNSRHTTTQPRHRNNRGLDQNDDVLSDYAKQSGTIATTVAEGNYNLNIRVDYITLGVLSLLFIIFMFIDSDCLTQLVAKYENYSLTVAPK